MNPYKKLTIELKQGRERFNNGEITLEEFEVFLKALYEEYLILDKKKNEKERKELLNLLFVP